MSDGLQSPGNAAMLARGCLGEIVYFLRPRQKILPGFFVGIPIVSFYKIAESVTQYVVARAQRKRPSLVRGHHLWPASIVRRA